MKCTDVAEFEQMQKAFLNFGSKERETDSLTPKELEQLEKFMKFFCKDLYYKSTPMGLLLPEQCWPDYEQSHRVYAKL